VSSNGYFPHKYQLEIHNKLTRFSVAVCHRRFGKTFMAINTLIAAAVMTKMADARFAYICPYLKQAKGVAFDYLKRFSQPIPGSRVNESELSIEFRNGARIRLYGSRDGQDEGMRGLYFDGVVLDEMADFDPDTWPSILRPALSDRKGWALFIGTPKGIDSFYELYSSAEHGFPQADGSRLKHPDWTALLYRADETGLMDADELAANRAIQSESQYAREWLCDFNASTDNTLITLTDATISAGRVYKADILDGAPKIIGVDVARFGGDRSVILRRQGLQAYPPKVFAKIDNMELVGLVAQEIQDWSPDAVFVDVGNGSGVIDRLRQIGHNVTEVNFGSRPTKLGKYVNKRTEMWSDMAEWIKCGGAIPNDPALKTDLCIPTYYFDASNKMMLESKDKIKERGGRSPDIADGLALTFAYPVAAMGNSMIAHGRPTFAQHEYDPYK
jgi:hypothetical protein